MVVCSSSRTMCFDSCSVGVYCLLGNLDCVLWMGCSFCGQYGNLVCIAFDSLHSYQYYVLYDPLVPICYAIPKGEEKRIEFICFLD